MACFQLAGIDPSFIDLFISIARGVDLLLSNFLSLLATKDSLT